MRPLVEVLMGAILTIEALRDLMGWGPCVGCDIIEDLKATIKQENQKAEYGQDERRR